MYKISIRIGLSLILLAYFARRVEWYELFTAFKEINVTLFLISTSAMICGHVIMTWKYQLLISKTNLEVPFSRMLAINFIARFYALFLPSAIGPEAVRWYKITKSKNGKASFLASTIVERLFFVLILFACGSIPLFFNDEPAIQTIAEKLWPALVFAATGLFLAMMYFLWPGFQGNFRKVVFGKFHLSPATWMGQFLQNFSLSHSSPHLVKMLFFYTLLWQLTFIFRIYFLFISIDLVFNLWDVTWMGSLVMLLQILPITFAGLGLREGAYAFLFAVQGVPAEYGVVVGLLFFSQMLLLSLIGWVCQLCENR